MQTGSSLRLLASSISLSLLSIYGCANTQNGLVTQGSTKPTSSNIVKVLNRVDCEEGTYYCRVYVSEITRMCLSKGYVREVPGGNIRQSRDIRELLTGTVDREVTEKVSREEVDDNGVVYTIEEPRSVTKKVSTTGYCIGSEYILD